MGGQNYDILHCLEGELASICLLLEKNDSLELLDGFCWTLFHLSFCLVEVVGDLVVSFLFLVGVIIVSVFAPIFCVVIGHLLYIFVFFNN